MRKALDIETEHEQFILSKDVSEHIATIGKALVDHAHDFVIDPKMTRAVTITSEIGPGITHTIFEIDVITDPYFRKKYEEADK